MRKNKNKVCIVGSSPRSRLDAPYDDNDYEIWGLNFGYSYMKRYDRYFEIHDSRILRAEHVKKLQELDVPIYTQVPLEGLKQNVIYPLQEIIDHFKTDYFTNSISYMIALAIYEGFEQIDIFGVDMAVSEEYGHQRPSCEYWIALARGKGIEVNLPASSDLCKTNALYAYNIKTEHAVEFKRSRKAELEARVKQCDEDLHVIKDQFLSVLKQKEVERAALLGALDEIRYNTFNKSEGEAQE